MTSALDTYLQGQYVKDCSFLRAVGETIAATVPVLHDKAILIRVRVRDDNSPLVTSWPYAVSAEAGLPTDTNKFSPSTHCMILFALDSLFSRRTGNPPLLLGERFRPARAGKQSTVPIADAVRDGKHALLELLNVDEKTAPLTTSSTYGDDDPFTLTWMAEILFRTNPRELGDGVPDTTLDQPKKVIAGAINRILERRERILSTEGFAESESCFLALRQLYLGETARTSGVNVTSDWNEQRKSDLWTRFDVTLHKQLSLAETHDAKFDPAELAFALEGALVLHPTWVAPALVRRVFETLQLSTSRPPFWRPSNPLLANARGHVLFLVSIEVANSILRSCEILDRSEAQIPWFSRVEDDLRVYASWLLSEKEEVVRAGQPYAGWRTEYEYKGSRRTIHLWYTSHVLVFLAHYHSLLRRKIGADGAAAASLQVEPPATHNANYWSQEPLSRGDARQHYAVIAKINREYISSRADLQNELKAPRSIVLYGPPGTGKTTLARNLAASLNRSLITVTVSDFLAAGALEIENRAKGIFEVLRSQEDMVVLFDEIDAFLLDRNTVRYRDQDSVFQFMTPGMLTKLQELRKAEGCIFLIATNYFERIDGAIKRPGRIDDRLLLSLPDLHQRRELLYGFANNEFFPDASSANDGAKPARPTKVAFLSGVEQAGIDANTALFGYTELKDLVERYALFRPTLPKSMSIDELPTLMAALKSVLEDRKVVAAANIESYETRFADEDPKPSEEFLIVLYLVLESGRTLNTRELEVTRRVLEKLGIKNASAFRQSLASELRDVLEDETFRAVLEKQANAIFP